MLVLIINNNNDNVNDSQSKIYGYAVSFETLLGKGSWPGQWVLEATIYALSTEWLYVQFYFYCGANEK